MGAFCAEGGAAGVVVLEDGEEGGFVYETSELALLFEVRIISYETYLKTMGSRHKSQNP